MNIIIAGTVVNRCSYTSLIKNLNTCIEVLDSVSVGRRFLIIGNVPETTLSIPDGLSVLLNRTSYAYTLVGKGAGNYVSVKPPIEHSLDVFFRGGLGLSEYNRIVSTLELLFKGYSTDDVSGYLAKVFKIGKRDVLVSFSSRSKLPKYLTKKEFSDNGKGDIVKIAMGSRVVFRFSTCDDLHDIEKKLEYPHSTVSLALGKNFCNRGSNKSRLSRDTLLYKDVESKSVKSLCKNLGLSTDVKQVGCMQYWLSMYNPI